MISRINSDQAGRDDLQGGVTAAIRRFFLNEFEGMLPAIVEAHDRPTNRVTVRPLVMIGTTDGAKVSRASVPNIPVYRFGAGGFFMSFPVKVGDVGWLKANDRDISLVMQRGGMEDWPNTERRHKFSDALFFPDTFKDWVIDGKNTDAAVWQSMDGTTCIAVDNGRVEVDAATVIVNSTATTVNTETAEVNATTSTTTTAPANLINGPLTVTGLITGAGGMTISGGGGAGNVARIDGTIEVVNGDVTADGISLKTHRHPYSGSSGNTQEPI